MSTTIRAYAWKPCADREDSECEIGADRVAGLDRPVDRFLDYALWLTARDLRPYWFPEVAAGQSHFDSPAHLIFALQAVGSPDVVRPLLKALGDGAIPPMQAESALALAATIGKAHELRVILDLALTNQQLPASRRTALVDGLVKAMRQRQVKPEGDLTPALALLDERDDALLAASALALGTWKLKGARQARNLGERR